MKTSYSLNHLLWTNIPLIFLLSEYELLFENNIMTGIIVLLWLIDLILVLAQFVNEEAIVTMNTDKISNEQKQRAEKYTAKYDELANID